MVVDPVWSLVQAATSKQSNTDPMKTRDRLGLGAGVRSVLMPLMYGRSVPQPFLLAFEVQQGTAPFGITGPMEPLVLLPCFLEEIGRILCLAK